MFQLFLINTAVLFVVLFVGAVVYGTTGDVEMTRITMSVVALLVALLVLPGLLKGRAVGEFDSGAIYCIAFAMNSMLLQPNVLTILLCLSFVGMAAQIVNTKEEAYIDRFIAAFPVVSTLLGGLILFSRWWSSRRSRA